MKKKINQPPLKHMRQLLAMCLFLFVAMSGFSQAALDIKVNGPGEAEPGDVLTYTISYSNIGGALANNVVIEMALPAGYCVYSESNPEGVCSEIDDKLTWTKNEIPELEQLNTGIYSITVNLIAGDPVQLTNSSGEEVTAYSITTDSETLTLSATIDSDELLEPVSSNIVTTEISRRCTFSINDPSAGIKSATGSTLTYLLALVNTGNVYEQYSLTSEISSGQELIQTILPMDSDTEPLSLTPFIAPGEIYFFRYRLESPTGTNPNQTTESSITATPVTCGEGANVVTTIIYGGQYDEYDLVSVYKIDTPDPVQAGSQLAYKIIVTNVGEALSDVYITETYPVNTSFVSADPSATYFNNLWHFPVLQPGNTMIDVVLNVQNNLPNGTELTNTVSVSDGSTTYSTFIETTTVVSAPDLAITKTASKLIVQPGEEVEYTISYENIGNRTAIGTALTDDYDATYMTVVDAAGGTESAGTLIWDLPDLLPGESGSRTYTMQVDADINNFPVGSTNLLNIATLDVDPTRPDSDLNNNQDYAVVTVQNVPDLVVDITSDMDPVVPNAEYTYTVTVSNEGEVDHAGHSYTVTAYLPASASYVSSSAGGVYSAAEDKVTWTVSDDLVVDASRQFTVTMQAPDCSELGSTLSVTADAYSDYWVDANPDDNEFTLDLNIEDTIAPEITVPLTAYSFECDQSKSTDYSNTILGFIAGTSVTDNCDIAPLLNHDYLGFTQACGEDFVITFTALDASGNAAEPKTITITFTDVTAPVITLPATDLALECFDATQVDSWTATATASDNCDGDVTVSASYTAPTGNCGQSITVTFTATDACGNTATETKAFTVDDKTAPVITLPSTDLALECFDATQVDSWTATATASDNCDGDVTVSASYTAPTG
ncbi:MAG: hypothetical protein AB7U05_18515, partial [Mangrovibacterium sp.]